MGPLGQTQAPPEYLPLSMAAAVAYMQVIEPPDRGALSRGLLDVVASALSVWIPIFGSRADGGLRVRLAEDEVARGYFCDGASRLRFRSGGPPVENLAVRRHDLEVGIRRLKRAGVRFAEAMPECSPRRVPRVLPRP